MVSLAPAGSRFVGYSIDGEALFAFPADTSQSSSEPASRRISVIDPSSSMTLPSMPASAVVTPKKSRSPVRGEEKEVTFAETDPAERKKSAY